jgi:hypothetical protein
MKILNLADLVEAYCKVTGKFAMYIRFNEPEIYDEATKEYKPDPNFQFLDFLKPAPYLKLLEDDDVEGKVLQIMFDGYGVLIFDNEKEMEDHFDMTVGDDGPTYLNSYGGPYRVYACTFDKDGPINENT